MKIGFALAGVAFMFLGEAPVLSQQPGTASRASAIRNPVTATAKSIDSGRKLFRQYCSPCHGADAAGDGPLTPKGVHPPNLVDDEWANGPTDGEIFSNIRNGIGPAFDMKAWKSRMTDADIWHIVNYLRSVDRLAPR